MAELTTEQFREAFERVFGLTTHAVKCAADLLGVRTGNLHQMLIGKRPPSPGIMGELLARAGEPPCLFGPSPGKDRPEDAADALRPAVAYMTHFAAKKGWSPEDVQRAIALLIVE